MKQSRKQLEDNLLKPIMKIKRSKKVVNDIKTHLTKYGIIDTQSWINNPSELGNLDIRELLLFTEQIHAKTGDSNIIVSDFFTDMEIKEARQFNAISSDDIIELPYTIPNVLQLSPEEYVCILDASEINKLMKSNILYYNMDIQREAKVTKRRDKVVVSPTINMKSVNEITNNLLEGKQYPSELKFNCAVGSSESGNEIIYDPKHMELTIEKTTRVDILDGMHRIQGITNAFMVNPDIKQKFTVSITNYTTRMAQLAQAQIAKMNKFSAQRIQELEQSRFSDMIVKQLKESDLKISQSNRVSGDQIVSYNVMADTIDEEFDIKNRAMAADIGDYLIDFFNFLLSTDDILNHINETRKTSLMLENSMFVGYIVLARRMFENGLKPREVRRILNGINFSRNDNSLWEEAGVVDSKGNFTTKARKAIKQYFEQMEIGDTGE
jgi:hypothetical protein